MPMQVEIFLTLIQQITISWLAFVIQVTQPTTPVAPVLLIAGCLPIIKDQAIQLPSAACQLVAILDKSPIAAVLSSLVPIAMAAWIPLNY